MDDKKYDESVKLLGKIIFDAIDRFGTVPFSEHQATHAADFILAKLIGMSGITVGGVTSNVKKEEINTKATNSNSVFDPVSRPQHYASYYPEPKDVIRNWKLSHNCATALSYIARHRLKHPTIDGSILDLRKAVQHLQFEIGDMELQQRNSEAQNATRAAACIAAGPGIGRG